MFGLAERNDVRFGVSGESRLGWCLGELRVTQVSGLVATWLICFHCGKEQEMPEVSMRKGMTFTLQEQ